MESVAKLIAQGRALDDQVWLLDALIPTLEFAEDQASSDAIESLDRHGEPEVANDLRALRSLSLEMRQLQAQTMAATDALGPPIAAAAFGIKPGHRLRDRLDREFQVENIVFFWNKDEQEAWCIFKGPAILKSGKPGAERSAVMVLPEERA